MVGGRVSVDAVPSNPFTDPNWAVNLADSVERVVGNVRDKTTKPIVKVTRAVVYGLLAAILGLVALVLVLIAATRGLQALIDLAVPTDKAVYLSYLVLGGLLSLVGLVLLRKRYSNEVPR